MPESSFNKVVFPSPLRPTNPTVSPELSAILI